MEILIWSIAIVLLLVGLVGTFVPLLPGTTLMLLGVLLQKWLLPDTLGKTAVIWIAVFWLMSVMVDFVCTMVGTKLFGGTKWGMAGASGGALVGMFFSLPATILGSILGSIAAEKLVHKRTNEEALRSGAGAAVGFVLGTVGRLACAFVMIGLYALSVWSALPWKAEG